MSAFDDLMAFQKTTEALAQVSGRLGWDQETVMPRGAVGQRAEEIAAVQSVLHARRTDPRLGEWLDQIDVNALDETGRAQIRHIRRAYLRTLKVPADLAEEIARVTSRAQGQWAEARADEDVKAFLPVLEEVVRLKREEGRALAGEGDLYDALIDDYEPDMKASDLAAMFDAMRPRLVALREAVVEKAPAAKLAGDFPEAAQLSFAQRLATQFGYDLNMGRIDKAVHPFSSGSGHDVRITTRTSDANPFDCFYSTIHEVGHACYEQGIDDAYALTPLGQGVSMGVHESQSRIYENQLGRSRAFAGWMFGEMRQTFGDIGVSDAEAFYKTVNAVHRDFIRTEADEVQYNLHIMLRFDLERALMGGDLAVADIEAAWNDRFEADFGYAVDKPSHGFLQDVHWSVGLFGYFPTYSLGNVYAGCLHAALRREVPDLDADLCRGDTTTATAWLRDKVQRFGGLRAPADTIALASGMTPSPEPLLTYLEEKFGALYEL